MGDFDYNRPRRPNPETISYLKSLPLSLGPAKEEITKFLEQSEAEADFPSLLAASLSGIDEIRQEVASLAGDEDGAQIIEIMAHIALPYSETAARILMMGLSGYHLHLATHRYGSHVVQTILQLAATASSEKDLAQHEDAPQVLTDDIPSLQDLILGMVEELTPSAPQLAVHICGSHVLRSLVCVLGGVQLKQPEGSSFRRGREKSKKKKKKKKHVELNAHPGTMELGYDQKDSRVTADTTTLQTLLDSLWSALKHGELQQMACHPSAGPLLMISLRVLTFSYCSDKERWHQESTDGGNHRLGIAKPQPRYELDSPAHDLVKRLLLLDDSEDKVGEIIYGMSGEPRGSHVLEMLMRISPDKVYNVILEKGDFASALQDYAVHEVSNFVVQALFSTVRNKEQAEVLLKSVEPLISSGYIVDASRNRVGIFWKAAELAAKFHVQQEPLLKALRIGTGLLATTSKEDDPVETEEENKKRRQKASSTPLQECMVPLLNLKPPVKHGDHVTLGVEGTRSIYYFLRFDPQLCSGVLDGLTQNLTEDELEMLAKDGLGSRCIWDGILDGPTKEKPFQNAARNLLTKLSGRWVALASDRVGHHSVKKLFGVLNLEDKAVLTAELAQGSNRLGGSTMGRSVMDACAVNAFLDGENAWNDAVRKLHKDDTWLNDLLVPEPEGKKKRKRKEKLADEDEVKKQKPSAVDLIVDTITKAVKD